MPRPGERHPARLGRHPREWWSHMSPVSLNPERESVIAQHVKQKLIDPLAA